MTKYRNEDGEDVDPCTPERVIWYSVACTYWTDDWDKIKTSDSDIPCCPVCSCVGMQTTMEEWLNGVDGYDEMHPGYRKFVDDCKENCKGNLREQVNKFLAEHEYTRKNLEQNDG